MTNTFPALALEAAGRRVIDYRRIYARHKIVVRIRFKEEVVEIGLPALRDALSWLRNAAGIVFGGSLVGVAICCLSRFGK